MIHNPALTYAIWTDLSGGWYGGNKQIPGEIYSSPDTATRLAHRLHSEFYGQNHCVRVYEFDARICTTLDYKPREYLHLEARAA